MLWVGEAQLVILMRFSLFVQFFILVFFNVFVNAVNFLLINEVVNAVSLFAAKVGYDLNSAALAIFEAYDTLAGSAFKASNALLRRHSSIKPKLLNSTLFFLVYPLRACF